jgi:hypothetical protein
MGRMRAAAVAVALACTTVGVVAAPPAVHAAGGTISGVVTDSSGVPIAGATVTASTNPSGGSLTPLPSTTTDAAGAYVLTDIPAAVQPWFVVATAPNHVPAFAGGQGLQSATRFVVSSAETYANTMITLYLPTATATGRVVDMNGNPVAGATVDGYPGDSVPGFGIFTSLPIPRATTDANGTYTITGLSPGRFGADVAPPVDRTDLLPQQLPTFTIALETDNLAVADITLGGFATISGRITDPSGAALAGATVVFNEFPEPLQTISNSTGDFTISSIYPGQGTLFADPPAGRALLQTIFSDASGTTISVPASGVLTGRDIRLREGTFLNFVVAGTTSPATQVVGCNGPVAVLAAGPTCSDPGTAIFAGQRSGTAVVPIGTLTMWVSESSSSGIRRSDPVQFTTTSGIQTDCTFAIGTASTCTARNPGGTISGVVRDSAGAPIAGASVRASTDVFGSNATPAVVTDTLGRYRLSGITANVAKWKVAAGAAGYTAAFTDSLDWNLSTGFLISATESYTADFTLLRASGSMSGVVTDDLGVALAGASLYLARLDQGPFLPRVPVLATGGPTISAADGSYSYDNLPAGRYHLYVTPPADHSDLITSGYELPQVDFSIGEAEHLVHDVSLTAGGTVTGVVTEPGGTPIAQALIRLVSLSGLQAIDPLGRRQTGVAYSA